jgi:hypothetical protein
VNVSAAQHLSSLMTPKGCPPRSREVFAAGAPAALSVSPATRYQSWSGLSQGRWVYQVLSVPVVS